MINYKVKISRLLGRESHYIYLYWKGRVALYSALLAAGIKTGDEIILPGLTCVVVPNAIIYTGAKPIYVDVKQGTLTIDPRKIKESITEKTKVIIIQNTFGLSSDIEEIIEIARSHNILTIDDCTHGFGGTYNNQPNGTLTDASFFSTQWNKPFSTGIGGILLINNPDKFPLINNINEQLIKPKKSEIINLWINLVARRFLLKDRTYWILLRFYRWLSKIDIVVGSSSASEIESTTMPEKFHKELSSLQAKIGIKAIDNLSNIMIERKKSAFAYREILKKNQKWHIDESFDKNNSHLKFPILVKNKAAFFFAAEKASVRLSDWFLSPIHPVESNYENWMLDIDKVPNAYRISQKLVTIHTDDINLDKTCNFLKENIDLIE